MAQRRGWLEKSMGFLGGRQTGFHPRLSPKATDRSSFGNVPVGGVPSNCARRDKSNRLQKKRIRFFLVKTQNSVAIDSRYIHSARVLQKEKSNGGKSQLKVQSQGVLKVDNPTLSLFLIEAPRVVVSTPPARQNDPLILWCSL